MMDLRGRAIRISHFAENGAITYKEGEKIEIRTDGYDIESCKEEIQINYYDLPPVMREGDPILFGENGQV